MVNKSYIKPLSEKHLAYKMIISEYPDTPVPKGHAYKSVKSLHRALEDIISLEKKAVDKFLSNELAALYEYVIYCKNNAEKSNYEEKYLTDYEKLLSDALNYIKKYLCDEEFILDSVDTR